MNGDLWALLAHILKGLCVENFSGWKVFFGFNLLPAVTQSREAYWATGHGAGSREWEIKP